MNKLVFDLGSTFFGGTHFLRTLTNTGRLVSILLNNAIAIAGTIFLILILIAGFNMITAGGDSQKFQRAQQIITTAVIGFIIILSAFLVVRVLEAAFKINVLG
ncbi:MAG: hypothetical protein UT08_C0005G0061 [Candidatus Woesebacteria bacterium GW2011_GWB1_38_8]|uniref:Uncharacterized protein n=1 Tax=Candidatus Woesebacteria bacterium GW2011_GWB1_38_8 TaxID=1618570 RepID=A0A0G0LCL3_9BACT|nr:MAG: hypothetical protein UT08_C0005G0061 [Candidatus Woesebacteria bacterium GW2011_GWB1_38_8]